MFVKFNKNPLGKNVGDCVVRAVSKVLDTDWNTAYIMMCLQGYMMKDLPASDAVWGEFLLSKGFEREIIPNTCPYCYTIGDFAADHPEGRYVLGTGRHAAAIVDGVIYDSWDSSNEVPIFYYYKE